LKLLAKPQGLSVECFYGGASYGPQESALRYICIYAVHITYSMCAIWYILCMISQCFHSCVYCILSCAYSDTQYNVRHCSNCIGIYSFDILYDFCYWMLWSERVHRRGLDIVVGTPGRMKDHINRGNLDLSEVKHAGKINCSIL
jgi:hypothetical protein